MSLFVRHWYLAGTMNSAIVVSKRAQLSSLHQMRPTCSHSSPNCSEVQSAFRSGSSRHQSTGSKPYAAAACILMIGLFLFIHFRHIPVGWGDVSQALIYHQVRKYLLRLGDVGLKYWRPQILLLVINPRASFETIRFANDLKKGGLFVVGRVLVGTMSEDTAFRQRQLLKASATG